MRAVKKQNMKINLNIDPFREEFMKKLTSSLNLPEGNGKINTGFKNGDISMNDLVNDSVNDGFKIKGE